MTKNTKIRLPIPGKDDNVWGFILNSFLLVSHTSSGHLWPSAIKKAGGITKINGKSPSNDSGEVNLEASDIQGSYAIPENGIPAADLNSEVQSAISTASSAVQIVNGKSGNDITLTASDVGAPTTLATDSDVSLSGLSNGHVLSYDSSTAKWINEVPPSSPISSVFGRTGTVTLEKSDITATGITYSDVNADQSGAATTAQANAQTYADTNKLAKSLNLSDLTSTSTARTNLGLGTAATQSSSAFDSAGSAASRIYPKGQWAGSTSYSVNDAVSANGAWWVCSTAHTSASSFDSDLSNWTLAASVGRRMFDVTAYGADPTGTSASDTAITNARNAARSAVGGIVYFPAGTYLINNPIYEAQLSNTGSASAVPSLMGHVVVPGPGDNGGAQATVTLQASSSFPSGQYMIDYWGNINSPNGMISGFTISGFVLQANNLAAGVRLVAAQNATVENMTGYNNGAPNPSANSNDPYAGSTAFYCDLYSGGSTNPSWDNLWRGVGLNGSSATSGGINIDTGAGGRSRIEWAWIHGCNGIGISGSSRCSISNSVSSTNTINYNLAGAILSDSFSWHATENELYIQGDASWSSRAVNCSFQGSQTTGNTEENGSIIAVKGSGSNFTWLVVGCTLQAETGTTDFLYVASAFSGVGIFSSNIGDTKYSTPSVTAYNINGNTTVTMGTNPNISAASATVLDGVTVSGSPSANQVLTATSSTAANWQSVIMPTTQGEPSYTGTYYGQVAFDQGGGYWQWEAAASSTPSIKASAGGSFSGSSSTITLSGGYSTAMGDTVIFAIQNHSTTVTAAAVSGSINWVTNTTGNLTLLIGTVTASGTTQITLTQTGGPVAIRYGYGVFSSLNSTPTQSILAGSSGTTISSGTENYPADAVIFAAGTFNSNPGTVSSSLSNGKTLNNIFLGNSSYALSVDYYGPATTEGSTSVTYNWTNTQSSPDVALLILSPAEGGSWQYVPAGASGDVSYTSESNTATVVAVQGVSVSNADATLLSQLNGSTARQSSTNPLGAGETTVFTGSTASQTLTLPTAAQNSTKNIIANYSSVAVSIAAGGSDIINDLGSTGSISLASNAAVGLVYNTGNAAWYVTSTAGLGGSGSGVASFNSRTGAVTPGNSDYLAVAYGGLTGATNSTRYVGATTSGAPTSGAFAVGDFCIDQTGRIWQCITAGTPGTWVALEPAQNYTARMAGLLAWNYDPVSAQAATSALPSGTQYLAWIPLPRAVNISNLIVDVSTVGTGLTTNECFGGIISSSGSVLGSTLDMSNSSNSGNWTTTGLKVMPLTPQSSGTLTGVGGGDGAGVWAVLLSNASTSNPKFGATGNTAIGALLNANASGASSRFGTGGTTGKTAITTLTPSGINVSTQPFWAGLS